MGHAETSAGAAGADTDAQAAASKSAAHGVVRGKVSWKARLCTHGHVWRDLCAWGLQHLVGELDRAT